MKRIILLFSLCLSIFHLHAQNDKKNLIGTHVAFGVGGYGTVRVVGAPSYDAKYYYTIGLDYSRQLSKRWDFCSGFEYTYNDLTMTPPSTGVERPSWSANLRLVTVPIQFKYHFGKLVYLNGGTLLNISATERSEAFGLGAEGWYPLNKEHKNGVALFFGFGMGIGFEHEFNSGMMLFLNPYARFNGIGKGLSLQKEALEHYKYLQGGVSLGIGYRF